MHIFVINMMAFITNAICCKQQAEYNGDSISSIETVTSKKRR